jgi:sulfur carrier protein ThiS
VYGRISCMKIKVRPVGIIRKYFTEHELETADGLTPEQLINALKIPGKLKMVSIVNGKSLPLKEKLKDGDEVILVTLLSGG